VLGKERDLKWSKSTSDVYRYTSSGLAALFQSTKGKASKKEKATEEMDEREIISDVTIP